MKQKFTEKEITDALNGHYSGNARYKLANAYIFKGDWESDFFVQKQNGYCYEFEVKVSRSDFFNDKKKISKHLILSTGKFVEQTKIWNENHTSYDDRFTTVSEEKDHGFRPNKFFYVVPAGMITIDELPPYAGLITYDGGSITPVKEAPFIHKEKLDFSSVLCGKFYAYWLDARFQVRQLKIENSHLEREVERLNKKIQNK